MTERRIIDYDVIKDLFDKDKDISELIKQRNAIFKEYDNNFLLFNLFSKIPVVTNNKQLDEQIKELNGYIVARANIIIKEYIDE